MALTRYSTDPFPAKSTFANIADPKTGNPVEVVLTPDLQRWFTRLQMSLAALNTEANISTGNYIIEFSDPLVLSLANGTIQELTLTGNIVSSSLVDGTSIGQELMWIIHQNATGGWTIGWPQNIIGGLLPSLGVLPNQTTIITLQWMGTGWRIADQAIN